MWWPTRIPTTPPLATFRRRFLKEVESLFVQVLVLAREMKLLKLGHIALDGTKIGANANQHKALSWTHANKIEAQLRQEVQTLLALAEKSGRAAIPDGMDVPEEFARREDRLGVIAQAKAKIEQRAGERYKAERDEFDSKQAKRKAQRDAGRTPRGKEPQPPQSGTKDGDQVNLTDEASRIMPVSGGGFEQSYNAQAGGGHRHDAGDHRTLLAGLQRQARSVAHAGADSCAARCLGRGANADH